MANFNYTVDTTPMAQSIDGVTSNVHMATAAIAAMQTAVVTAEVAAANNVCKHVDEGFFSLIRSQLSQKMAHLRSIVDSRFLEMRAQSQALAGVKSRMERDYQMISARYTKVFRAIDLTLRGRVMELDKAVAGLVSREVGRLDIRMKSLQAQVPMHQMESVRAGQLVAASQTRVDAQRAIRSMGTFLVASGSQSRFLESMLFRFAQDPKDLLYAPVLVMECETMAGSGSHWEILTPGDGNAKQIANTINAAAQHALHAELGKLRWSAPGARALVDNEFGQLAARSGLNQRLQAHVARLWQASAAQELSGVGE